MKNIDLYLIGLSLIMIMLLFKNCNKLNELFKSPKKKFYFQHNNKIQITRETYNYVYNYKKQLVENITKLLNDLGIKFVVAHGNLIEIERKKPIYHDDDIDIRFNINDIDKWKAYIINNKDSKNYNLVFDDRLKNIKKQKYDGIQVGLYKFKNEKNIKEFPEMDIHLDLVGNIVENKFWMDYNIDYNNLRKVKFMDIQTTIPSKKDTKMVLSKQYGENYIIPNKIYIPF